MMPSFSNHGSQITNHSAPRAHPQVFASRQHPGAIPAGLVYARAFVRPLAACMLPLMIATLVAVLEGERVMGYVTWGFPAALLAASLWTFFRLYTTPAELHVREDAAALRTVWECLQPATRPEWQPVVDLRRGSASVYVGIGQTSYELSEADWPDFHDLVHALQHARGHPLPYPGPHT